MAARDRTWTGCRGGSSDNLAPRRKRKIKLPPASSFRRSFTALVSRLSLSRSGSNFTDDTDATGADATDDEDVDATDDIDATGASIAETCMQHERKTCEENMTICEENITHREECEIEIDEPNTQREREREYGPERQRN